MNSRCEVGGAGLSLSGPLIMETATALCEQGLAALKQCPPTVDLAAVTEVDSSGLAVLFAWQRATLARGKSLRLVNPPRSLISLAEMYGVRELLPTTN